VDQSRQEIASHRSKTVELEQTLQQISQLEGEASNRVIEARAALAEQAERLASAEKHSQELSLLKSEIVEGVSSIKREMGATKAVLTGLEKQMEQMRQVELYAQSIRQDYEQKMGELSNYIKHGNEDFETLRESVEANFVRRYLKELRELTESYGYEFAQAKKVEGSIDERIYDEKKRLEDLMEEGRKIAHLYELQSKEVQGAESFEKQGEKLAEIEQLAEKRTQIESMIAQIVGGRSALSPKVASAPIKARGYAKPKAAAAPKAKKAAKKSKLKTKQHSKSKSRKKKGRR
jgi:chromosome segregation ATPase